MTEEMLEDITGDEPIPSVQALWKVVEVREIKGTWRGAWLKPGMGWLKEPLMNAYARSMAQHTTHTYMHHVQSRDATS